MTDPTFHVRALATDDYPPIITVLDDWWGGRRMSGMLPKLFFTHFSNTSFVAEDDSGDIAGFVVGFFSPTHADEAYIHFVGVNPSHRKAGVGRMLYERFFELMCANHRRIVRCVTSPINTVSIGFHMRLGFAPKSSDTTSPDGVPYVADYDGPGEHRVLFSKTL